MQLLPLFSALFLLIGYGLCVDDISMERYSGPEARWAQTPTYFAIRTPPADKQEVTYQDVRDTAEKYFNWYNSQSGIGSGDRLVSVFYAPMKRKFYIGTVPKGLFTRAMTEDAESAPNWLNQVRSFWVKGATQHIPGKNFWHAEDHAYYLYESKDGGKGEARNGQYPHGSMIATWGIQSRKAAGVVPLCSTTDKRAASCVDVAKGLGVEFHQPSGEAYIPQEDLMDELSSDEERQWAALCAAPANQQTQHQKRDEDTEQDEQPPALPAIEELSIRAEEIESAEKVAKGKPGGGKPNTVKTEAPKTNAPPKTNTAKTEAPKTNTAKTTTTNPATHPTTTTKPATHPTTTTKPATHPTTTTKPATHSTTTTKPATTTTKPTTTTKGACPRYTNTKLTSAPLPFTLAHKPFAEGGAPAKTTLPTVTGAPPKTTLLTSTIARPTITTTKK